MAEKLSTASYKGSRDFYPDQMRVRSWMFHKMGSLVSSFGFERIDAPMIEPIEIYLAKTSEEIVNQQIYSFTDRGDRKVAMRPEMTPTVARMVAGKIRELPRPVRWFSIPNLWRYEKPGKGRLREHWQLNADILGVGNELLADIEIIQLAIDLLYSFGADHTMFRVMINHRQVLNLFFNEVLKLPEERWAEVSRVMDKRSKISQEELFALFAAQGLDQTQSEEILHYMDSGLDYLKSLNFQHNEPIERLIQVISSLEKLGYHDVIEYAPSVVRGFDYYTGIVFEIFDRHPDNRRSLFGGGRYNNLVSAFTRDQINAVGFGMGDVTFLDFLAIHNLVPEVKRKTSVYICLFEGETILQEAFSLAKTLRAGGVYTEISSGHAKMGKQLDEANQKNIPWALIIGETEVEKKVATLKELATGEQHEVAFEKLVEFIKNRL